MSSDDEGTALIQIVQEIVEGVGGIETRDVVDDSAIVATGFRHGDLTVIGHEDVTTLVEYAGLNAAHHLRTGNHHRVGHVADLSLGTEAGNSRIDVEHINGLEAVGNGAVKRAVLNKCCGHIEPVGSLTVVDHGVELLQSDDVLRSLGDIADSRSLSGGFVTTLARSKSHGYQHH